MSTSQKRKVSATGPAVRPTKTSHPALTPSPLPIDADSCPTPKLFLSRGARCGFCLMPIEETARGEEARHEGSLTPYGECEAAKRIPIPVEQSGDIQEMRPVNVELIARLDHYDIDPRDIKHWAHVRETTGGSHRLFRPVFPGEA